MGLQFHCRDQLTLEDQRFVEAYVPEARDMGAGGWKNPELRDHWLDSKVLFRVLLEDTALAPVSPALYFYVLLRHALMEQGMYSQNVADYLAAYLVQASQTQAAFPKELLSDTGEWYLGESWEQLMKVSATERFFLSVQLGNRALLMTGVFYKYLESRMLRKSALGVHAYASFGKERYAFAANHTLANEYAIHETLGALARHFECVRAALEVVSDRLMFL